MASVGKYKSKIRSAKNIAKITKAMQFVAASKMKRAQEAALAGKDYAMGLLDMTSILSKYIGKDVHPLITRKENAIEKTLLVLVAPQKGLCGGLVTNLTRFTAQKNSEEAKRKVEVVAIGSKAKLVARRLSLEIVADFELGLSHPTYDMVPPIARLIEEKFTSGEVDKVEIIYADFINTMLQVPRSTNLLPLDIAYPMEEGTDKVESPKKEYLFEPDPKSIVEPMLGMYLETELYQILLEAYASEQSARMVAMKNATENATSLISDLTVEYNKVRQASITNEILDINNARMISV